MDEAQPTFLNVPELLERSQPSAHRGWFWYAVGVFLLIVMISAYVGVEHPAAENAIHVLSLLAMFALATAMVAITFLTVRNQRLQQEQLDAVSELIQLRRWPEAATIAQNLLSRPTRSPALRAQALIYLTSVLARYHR